MEEIQTLKTILVKTQTRSGETAEKAFIILKNAYAVIQNAAADVNVKGTSGEVSAGNAEHVIECWRKSVSCYKVAGNLPPFQRPQKLWASILL